MRPDYEKLLEKVAKDAGYDLSKKGQALNPLENSMWENMLDGALKALEIVALATFDLKLTAIVKLLQSWLKDKREEKARKQQEAMYGAGYSESYRDDSFDYSFDINPYF